MSGFESFIITDVCQNVTKVAEKDRSGFGAVQQTLYVFLTM